MQHLMQPLVPLLHLLSSSVGLAGTVAQLVCLINFLQLAASTALEIALLISHVSITSKNTRHLVEPGRLVMS